MKLIADSGSTKVDWRIITDRGMAMEVSTPGINPVFQSDEAIADMLRNSVATVSGQDVTEVFFYGAGVVSDEIASRLDKCFKSVFPGASCVFNSDILGAARALFGHRPGIACILGTGSNSCFYDGTGIVGNVKAGGFILGDEASGAYFGKLLVSDYVKGLLPAAIEKEFRKRYGLEYADIVAKVYREPLPSRFLASFSPFILEFCHHPHIARMLREGFDAFFARNVAQYDYRHFEVGFVGSVAFHYREFIEKSAKVNNIRLASVIKSPIDALAAYHAGQ